MGWLHTPSTTQPLCSPFPPLTRALLPAAPLTLTWPQAPLQVAMGFARHLLCPQGCFGMGRATAPQQIPPSSPLYLLES